MSLKRSFFVTSKCVLRVVPGTVRFLVGDDLLSAPAALPNNSPKLATVEFVENSARELPLCATLVAARYFGWSRRASSVD